MESQVLEVLSGFVDHSTVSRAVEASGLLLGASLRLI